MTNWVITGGCGFVGSNLVHRLALDKSNSIRIIDNFSSMNLRYINELNPVISKRPLWKNLIEVYEADIVNLKNGQKILDGADILVHLAANSGVKQSILNPIYDCNVNVLGLINILNLAKDSKIPKFIFASSNSVLGENKPPYHENLIPNPISPYGAGKLAGEFYLSVFNKCYGLETISLRFSNVYGEFSNHKKSVVASLLNKIINGEDLLINGSGNQTRDFIYAKDLVDALILSSKKVVSNEIFQIGSGKEVSIKDLLKNIIDICDKRDIKVPNIKNGKNLVGDVKKSYSNIQKAKSLLNWQPKTCLEEGLKKTIDYYLEKK